MKLDDFTDRNIIAAGVVIAGGFLRILLNVDPSISKARQLAILFFGSLPFGWFVHDIAFNYGYEIFAYPAGFLSGIMALSILSTLARDGGKVLIDMIRRGGKGA